MRTCEWCEVELSEDELYYTMEDTGPFGLFEPKEIGSCCEKCHDEMTNEEEEDE